MPAIKKAINLLGDDIVELSTGNETLENKKGLMMRNGFKPPRQNC